MPISPADQQEFSDADVRIVAHTDQSKKLKFDVTALPANTTTTVAFPLAVFPIGSVLDYAGTSIPSLWLACYGQAISRTTYADLFTAISTTYGTGDGSTTFNVPDLRGRVTAGKDDMGGTSANRLTNQSGGLNGDTLGASGGEETHTSTIAEMPAHTHPISVRSVAGTSAVTIAEANGGATSSIDTGSAGSGNAHNNVQPTLILNKIIYAGV